MILLLLLATSTFHSSFVRALKMWRAENETQLAAPPVVLGHQEAQCQVSQGSQGPQEEEVNDTPYTHTSFFSDSTKSLTRRRTLSNLPLPQNLAQQVPQRSRWQEIAIWGKFILVWLCMILVVAMRGGSGHSIVSVRSCSWEPLGALIGHTHSTL